jgi:hypothetical protein
VDRVYTCPAYVQVLTGSKNSKVNIGAVAEISAPIVGPVGTGGGVKWEWGVETSSGIENHASHTDYVCFRKCPLLYESSSGLYAKRR